MRCQITNLKKLRKLRELTGLPIAIAMTRGGTGHRVDLFLEGKGTFVAGSWSLFPDGTLVRYGDNLKIVETRKVEVP